MCAIWEVDFPYCTFFSRTRNFCRPLPRHVRSKEAAGIMKRLYNTDGRIHREYLLNIDEIQKIRNGHIFRRLRRDEIPVGGPGQEDCQTPQCGQHLPRLRHRARPARAVHHADLHALQNSRRRHQNRHAPERWSADCKMHNRGKMVVP